MSDEVFIVADRSGKMTELGKDHLEMYVFLTVTNLLNTDRLRFFDYSLYTWSTDVQQIDCLELENFGGKSDPEALAGWMMDLPEGSKVLLLSDGNFDAKPLRMAIKENGIHFVSLVIGADCMRRTMDTLSVSGKAYGAEDVTLALNILCHGKIGGSQ